MPLLLVLLLALALPLPAVDLAAPLVLVQALRPAGLRICVRDGPGLQRVEVDASVNAPLAGEERGQLRGLAAISRFGFWVLREPGLALRPGDAVAYRLTLWEDGAARTLPPALALITEFRESLQLGIAAAGLPPELVSPECALSVTTVNGRAACRGQLIFQEDFSVLNRSRWQHSVRFSTTHNYEFATYTDGAASSWVQAGLLHVRPAPLPERLVTGRAALSLPGCTQAAGGGGGGGEAHCRRRPGGWDALPPVLSARLHTRRSFAFRFGRVDVRARLATGDWLFNHVWLERRDAPFQDDVQESGRIDVAWLRGNANFSDGGGASSLYANVGTSFCHQQLFWGDFVSRGLGPGELWSDRFRVYSVRWSPDVIKFRVDGRLLYRMSVPRDGFLSEQRFQHCAVQNLPRVAPLDKEMAIYIALQVGGFREFGGDGVRSGVHTKPWKDYDKMANLHFWQRRDDWLPTWSGERAELQVDWIRVWAL